MPRKKAKSAKTSAEKLFRSRKSKTDASYRARLKTLKTRYGADFGFKTNAKLTPQRKAAITRKMRKMAEFLNPENNFQYVRLKQSDIKRVRRRNDIAKQQITAKGVFIPKPKSRRHTKTRVRIERSGDISTRTGNFTSTFRLYPSVDVVRDPAIIARDARASGAEAIFVSIKGHRGGSRKNGYSLKAFMRYLNEMILPDIEEAQEDENKKTAFRNWFGVEFVTYEWRKHAKTSRNVRKSRKRSS